MRAEDVIVVGSLRTIGFARDAAGKAHARDFMEGECPSKDRDRLRRRFLTIAEYGERAGTQQTFKHERGSIHAFKSDQARVAAFRTGDTWLLTHGFLKKSGTWPRNQLLRAERIRAEHLTREGLQ